MTHDLRNDRQNMCLLFSIKIKSSFVKPPDVVNDLV